jgi:uncharacterized membrane protein YeaQ/YmgE (transglycosylase-associated protein family)
MLWLLIWAVYGALVGLVAEFLYRGGPKSWASTIGIGVAGSYMGGLINFLFGRAEVISQTGLLMGLVGAIVCLWIWDKFRLSRIINLRNQEIRRLRR